MTDGFVWLSYLVTYGLIVGYGVTVWNRIRTHRERSADRRP